MQRVEHPSIPERRGAHDTPTKAQQQDNTVRITASEGVPAWMLSTSGTAGSSSQEHSVSISKSAARFLLQYLDMALESCLELLAHPQIFQSMQGSCVFSSTANTPLSFMNIGSSSSQNLQAAQEFKIPVPHPGSGVTATAQQGVQMH